MWLLYFHYHALSTRGEHATHTHDVLSLQCVHNQMRNISVFPEKRYLKIEQYPPQNSHLQNRRVRSEIKIRVV